LIIVNQLTYAQTNWTVGDLIRMGTMNIHLLRPISPIYDALASELAGKVVYLSLILPLTGILGLVLKPELAFRWINFLFFMVALGLAWGLRFLWGYWIALLAFWASRASALLAIQDSFIFLFAGQVAPVVLLPGIMLEVALYLPFRYMIGFPVEILIGSLTETQIKFGFAIQIGWLMITWIIFLVIWRSGVKRFTAVGG
jgi:ABC-2 type transport system permease protein